MYNTLYEVISLHVSIDKVINNTVLSIIDSPSSYEPTHEEILPLLPYVYSEFLERFVSPDFLINETDNSANNNINIFLNKLLDVMKRSL